ncbi:migration and invasion enhancer 1-like [Patiria miniata]|uniref:Selenoprotein W n=1 Tax=Patiria miniata TaxID=46514 RepID=A0A914BQ78_PATMI|nr:migration and invasion enhancer 1-like [Patiria miniata]
MDLHNDIKSGVPGVAVDGRVGRSTSFEVTLNGKLLFSKLKTGGFPINTEIVTAIKEYKGEGDVTPVTNTASNCVLL